jgi:glycosyltransferase involved in cell wall biosynthesis
MPFVANSASTASALAHIGVEPGRIHVVHPGVDPPVVSGLPRDDQPLFVCAGRLMPHKRVDLLLRVWERVQPVVGGRLIVIGDGPERASLEAMAGDGVEFVGRVDETTKWRLLGEAWGLMHSAQHEGWGIVITEAAQVGTPTIGFNVPGVKDAILDGESGILVESEDDLVREWIAFVGSPERRDHLSEGARRYAALFGWNHIARDFEAVATHVVGSSARR